VIGGVRDPNSKTSQALLQLPKGKDSKLIIVKIENTSETDASAAVELLKSKHGITALDVRLYFSQNIEIYHPTPFHTTHTLQLSYQSTNL